MRPIKMAVVGLGHMGKQHVRICHHLKGCNLVGVVDTNAVQARKIGRQYRVPYYLNHQEMLDRVEAVSLATPTISHYPIARDMLSRRIHTFIEKPLAATIDEGKELIGLARRRQALVQVGHIERFNPALEAVREYIQKPRFIESHRLSPLSFRSLDIDVILDLMIHDVDIVLSLLRTKPKEIYATGVNVFSKRLDIANARLVFPGGCVANLTASRVSDKSMRKMRIFSDKSYVSIDFLTRTAKVYRKRPGAPVPERLTSYFKPTEIKDYAKLMLEKFLEVHEPKIKPVDQLEQELASFIQCIRGKCRPLVSGKDGFDTLKVTHQIVNQIRSSATCGAPACRQAGFNAQQACLPNRQTRLLPIYGKGLI